jgi:hypothetical protein
MDANLIITILTIALPIIATILGWIIHRKTEKIKIMQNQLSDKKYQAYANIVSTFYSILKDSKNHKTTNQKALMEQMIDSKRDILMYGSDSVFKAFNNYLVKSSENTDATTTMNSFLDFIIAIRKDMCGKQTKVTKRDILINLVQNESEIDSFLIR